MIERNAGIGNGYNYIAKQYLTKYQFTNYSIDPKNNPGQINYDIISQLSTWNKNVSDLENTTKTLYDRAYELLYKKDGLSSLKPSSVKSDNALIFTKLTNRAINGSFTLQVNQLAQSMQVKSDPFSNIYASLGISGKFNLNNKTFNVTDNMSINDIKNMINGANIGVTANISPLGEMMIASNTTGIQSAFTAVDLTNDSNVFSSNDTNIATTNTLINNSDWSHQIDVVQLASKTTTAVSIGDDYSVLPTNYSNVSGSWTWNNNGDGIIEKTSASASGNVLYDTTTWDDAKTASATLSVNTSDGKAGVYLDYVDANNYTSAYFDTNTNRFIMEKMTGGVRQRTQTNYNVNLSTYYNVEMTTDGAGNYNATLKDSSGNTLTSLNATWTNAVVGGKSGVFGNNTGEVDITGVDFSGTKTVSQDAIYSVDGVQYTSSTNNQVSIGDATINLINTGSATVSNVVDNDVLADIGILSAGTFKHVIQNAQDSSYSINGGATATGSTNVVYYNGVEMTLKGTTITPATITVGGNEDDLAISYDEISQLIEEYNNTISYLNENITNDNGFLGALKGTYLQERTNLSHIGITSLSDGTLKIDEEKLKENLENNPNNVKSIFLKEDRFAMDILKLSKTVLEKPYDYAGLPPEFNFDYNNFKRGTVYDQYF